MAIDSAAPPEPGPPPFGTCVELTTVTRLLIGRPLDLAERACDVGNVLLHRHGDTLYVIDSGATQSFRARLLEAAEGLRPFRQVVLLSSHGHPDHVGNNGAIDDIEADSRLHYASRADFHWMRDPRASLMRTFGAAAEFVDLPAPPMAFVDDLLRLFQPLDPRVEHVRAIESLPTQALEIGGAMWEGWAPGDDMQVLAQHGHTPGHLFFYIPSQRLLFVGDEINSFYPVWHDSRPSSTFGGLRKALRMLRSGAVELLVDGHLGGALGAEQGKRLLSQMVNDYLFFDHVVLDALRRPGGATIDECCQMLRTGEVCVNENGLFARMQVLRKMQMSDARPLSGTGSATRFGFA